MKRVGILGGMGPQATVLLMQKIIAATHDKNAKASNEADPLTRSLSRLLEARDGRVEVVTDQPFTARISSLRQPL